MIRIDVGSRELKDQVEAFKPGWIARAADRTATFITNEKYEEPSSTWSEFKPVFMEVQAFKCAYCERALAGRVVGRAEHDLEHYRPKSNVKVWPNATAIRERNLDYDFPTGEELETGYYWLAYDLGNYVTACKPCNSALKSNYFPIAGTRARQVRTISQLFSSEKPYLIFPLGRGDADPRTLITFHGAVAVPKPRQGAGKRRAQVTIDFFQLNDRDELWTERYHCIRELWSQYDRLNNSSNARSRSDARQSIDELREPDNPHSSCANAFYDLCDTDIEEAFRVYQHAHNYVRQIRPG
jgi:hypothetical protein